MTSDEKRRRAAYQDEDRSHSDEDALHSALMNKPIGGNNMEAEYLPAPDNGELGFPLPDANRKSPWGI